MNYLKIIFRISPFKEWFRDLLILHLAETGFEGFIETSSGFEAYIDEKEYKKYNIRNFAFPEYPKFTITTSLEIIENRNWNEEWEKNYFNPLLIAGQCLIRAPFHKNNPEAEIEIIIEPNMAFGTGHHETTSLMLESILDIDIRNKSVLDMGCGTGILSILAAKRGATLVTAIDTDEWACRSALENAAINNISNIKVIQGDASNIPACQFNMILANIHKNAILSDLTYYTRALKKEGQILLSGFFCSDLDEITLCATENGLHYIGSHEKNKWMAASYVKI